METWRRPSRPAQPPRRGGRASQGPAGCDGRAGRVSETGQVICRASGPPSPGLRQSVGPIVRQPTARDTCGCSWPMPGCCWRMPRVKLRSSTVASAAGVSPKLSAACRHPTRDRDARPHPVLSAGGARTRKLAHLDVQDPYFWGPGSVSAGGARKCVIRALSHLQRMVGALEYR